MDFVFWVLLLAAPQGETLEKRVRALVDELQSDEIQRIEDAVTGLVALGSPAIGPIREEIKKVSGDAKLRLDEVVRSIERNVRRGRAQGAPVLLTLALEDIPLAQALLEFRKISGQPLAWKDLPPGKVSISFERTPFWEALDRLCRSHGGIMWSVKEREIVISPRSYRNLPKVFHGNQVVYFNALSSDRRRFGGAVSSELSLEGAVAWARGGSPPDSELRVEELRDDRGTDLALPPAAAPAQFSLTTNDAFDPDSLVRELTFSQELLLPDEAKALARLRGEVRLEYALDYKRLATLEKPQSLVGKPVRTGMLTITLKRFDLEEGTADVRIHLVSTNVREKLPLRTNSFRILDAKGKAYGAAGWVNDDVDEEKGKIDYDISLDFTLPEGKVDVASLEIAIPTELETVSIPFDFKDVPFR